MTPVTGTAISRAPAPGSPQTVSVTGPLDSLSPPLDASPTRASTMTTTSPRPTAPSARPAPRLAPRPRPEQRRLRGTRCRRSGDEGNRTPNPRLAKSTEGWFGAVGYNRKPVLTRAFTVGRWRAVLAVFGRFADYLRTVCGLRGGPQPRRTPLRETAPAAHPRGSLSDCAGRRKGACASLRDRPPAGRRGDPPAPLLDVVLLGVSRDDPVVHGRQEPAAGRFTAQYEAVSAVQAPDVRLARGRATAGRDEDLARAEAGHRSFERCQERFDRLIRRRSRHKA